MFRRIDYENLTLNLIHQLTAAFVFYHVRKETYPSTPNCLPVGGIARDEAAKPSPKHTPPNNVNITGSTHFLLGLSSTTPFGCFPILQSFCTLVAAIYMEIQIVFDKLEKKVYHPLPKCVNVSDAFTAGSVNMYLGYAEIHSVHFIETER